VKPALQGGDLPSGEKMSWKWTPGNKDIILENTYRSRENEDEVLSELGAKNLQHFAEKLEIEGLGPGMIKIMWDAGINTPGKLLGVTTHDLRARAGLGEKQARNIVDAVQKTKHGDMDCVKLMEGSNVFGRGFGKKKLRLIVNNFPNLLVENPDENKLASISGFSQKSAAEFIQGLEEFRKFMQVNGISCENHEQRKKGTDSHHVGGPNVVFTGFRNEQLASLVENDYGGTISDSVSKNTDVVVVKNDLEQANAKPTGKIKKAKELGIPTLVLSDLPQWLENTF
jgi:NAD-dependent DNA ligase